MSSATSCCTAHFPPFSSPGTLITYDAVPASGARPAHGDDICRRARERVARDRAEAARELALHFVFPARGLARGDVLRQLELGSLIAQHADRRREAGMAFLGLADAIRDLFGELRRFTMQLRLGVGLHLIGVQRGDADDAHCHDQQRGEHLDDREAERADGRHSRQP